MKKVLIVPFHISKKIPDAEYLAEGIVEELIDFIPQLKSFTTLGRNLSLYLKIHPIPGKVLVKEFGVDYIIEGAVKQDGAQVILSVRLIKAITEQVIANQKMIISLEEWTTQLREVTIDLLKVKQPFDTAGERRSNKKNVRELFLKGLYHWNRFTYEEMKTAIYYYNQVIQKDPAYAPAYAGISDCYSVIAVMGYESAMPAFKNALKYVNKALALNDKHSDSYLAATLLNLFYQNDFEKAKINLDYALALNRNNPKVHHLFSFYYSFRRNFDLSEKHCLLAIKFDPFAIPQYIMLIRLSIYRRDYKKAMELIEATLLIDENSAIPINELKAQTYLLSGNIESAISVYRDCIKMAPANLLNYGFLAHALAIGNFPDESLKVETQLDNISLTKNIGNYDYAKSLIKLGRKNIDGFFYHFETAFELGLTSIVGDIYNNPIYSEIRKDDRYKNFLIRTNLDPSSKSTSKIKKPISQLKIQSNTKEQLTLDPQDIAYIQGDGNYCAIYWYEKKVLQKKVLRITLKQLESLLSNYDYLIRTHKSFLVNLDEELSLSGNARGYFLECANFPIRIPISRTKSQLIKELILSRK